MYHLKNDYEYRWVKFRHNWNSGPGEWEFLFMAQASGEMDEEWLEELITGPEHDSHGYRGFEWEFDIPSKEFILKRMENNTKRIRRLLEENEKMEKSILKL